MIFLFFFFASVCGFFLASRLFVAQFRVSKSLVVAVLLMMTELGMGNVMQTGVLASAKVT